MSELQSPLTDVDSNECLYCGRDLSSCTCCGLRKFGDGRNCRYCGHVVCSRTECSVKLTLLVTDSDSKTSGRCCTYCWNFYCVISDHDDINVMMKGELQKRDEHVSYCDVQNSSTYMVTMRRDRAKPDATFFWQQLHCVSPKGNRILCEDIH